MLKSLAIWNFALIEHVEITFHDGLNILTGETGAGKSILIDALGAALGRRLSAELIRHDCAWLRVEAAFDVTGRDDIRALLAEKGLVDEGDELLVSRQLAQSGRGMIRINGCQATLGVLKAFGELLVDVHGQHENQALMRPGSQMALVDSADAKIRAALEAYRAEYRAWRAVRDKRAQVEADSMENARRIDMLKWQIEEISSANLKIGEDEKLEADIKVLSHAEKISGLLRRSYELLEGGKCGVGAISALGEIKRNLEGALRYDDKLAGALQMVAEALCQVEECGYQIRDYGEAMEFSPQRLDKLQSRMDVIYKLRKKYGATVEEVLAHCSKAQQELEEIENYEQTIEKLQRQEKALEARTAQEAAALTAAREKAAQRLAGDIQKHLVSLGMPNAALRIEVRPRAAWGESGADDIEILFSANLGEDPKPLAKVASGGELSRIALAVKVVVAARERVRSMIFDEIDTGIGGKTAQMVAERIAMVAAHKQVLCITHLPQIACMADAHLYIDKEAKDGKTATQVRPLSDSERTAELARMTSGDITPASLAHAAEMVRRAVVKKAKWKESSAARA